MCIGFKICRNVTGPGERWYELEEIMRSVQYNDEGYALVWQYDSKGIYTTQSLYAVIN